MISRSVLPSPVTDTRSCPWRRCLCFLLLLVCLPASLQARSLNETMADIGTHMLKLYPVILRQGPLDREQRQLLLDGLPELEALFNEAEPHIRKRSAGYLISYKYLLQHLQRASMAARRGDFNFVRSQLYEIGTICSSCHTQDTRLRSLFSGTGRGLFSDDFAYAEFNFFTRNYAQAVEYYDRYLRQGRPITEWQLIQPLQRLVTIYAQVYNNPGQGAKRLAEYTDIPGHSDATRKQLRGWIRGLRDLDQEGAGQRDVVNLEELQKEVHRFLGRELQFPGHLSAGPEQQVQRVWLRGLLYRYLATVKDRDQVPQLLYWLALSNRAIGYEYYFSLADLYLKECVMSWPKHPVAHKCFIEYRTYIDHAYGGSGGSYIPEEVEQELDAMTRALGKN